MVDDAAPEQDPAARGPSAPRLRLVIPGSDGTREYDLPLVGECPVGRTSAAFVALDDPSVSRAHAVLRLGHDGVTVADQRSRNGTFVNGAPVPAGGMAVRAGDTLSFGTVNAVLVESGRPHPATSKAPPEELDRRLAAEGERAIRHARPLAAVVVAPHAADQATCDGVAAVVTACLRSYDVAAARHARRFDVLLPECSKDDAVRVARRMDAMLRERRLAARLGVAVFPAAAPSVESLFPSAEAAMRTVPQVGFGVAHAGSRVLRLDDRAVLVLHPAMLQLYALLGRLAQVPAPVLVVGAAGSGTSTVARALHALGPRASQPLVRLDCVAQAGEALSRELLGGEGTALARAAGGTLLLREVAAMPLDAQAVLMHVLQTRAVGRTATAVARPLDVRVIATTAADLETAQAEGAFRRDLFHCLSELVVTVPPLRERRGEILLLAQSFADEAARESRRARPTFSPGVEAALRDYAWPGNLDELREVVTAAMGRCQDDEIRLSDLPPEVAGAWPSADDGAGWEPRTFGDTSVVPLMPGEAVVAPPAGDERVPASPERVLTGEERVPAGDERPATPDAFPIVIPSQIPYDDAIETLQRTLVERALSAAGGTASRAAALLHIDRRRLTRLLHRLGLD